MKSISVLQLFNHQNQLVMKHVFFLLIVTFFLTSCGPCDCKLGEANVQIVQTMYDAFAEGNVEGVVALLSPDIQWNEADNFIYAGGNPYIGPDAVVEGVFAPIGADWESFNLVNMEVKPVGGTNVLATGRYQGKHKASGKSLDAQFAHVWTIQDGKATRFQQYTDTKQAMEVVIVDVEDMDNGDE